MSLDPNDPRPPYLQVAAVLRRAIESGHYSPGSRIPSGPELARKYGVARMTVQQSVRVLKAEGLVVSRQGSGVFVRTDGTKKPKGRPRKCRVCGQPSNGHLYRVGRDRGLWQFRLCEEHAECLEELLALPPAPRPARRTVLTPMAEINKRLSQE